MVVKISSAPLIQEIESDKLEDRLDTKFYNQKYFEILDYLDNSKSQLLNLRNICIEKIHRGKTPTYVKEGTIPVIKTINIRNDKLDWSNLSFTSEEYYEKSLYSQVFKNDILLASTGVGSLGKIDIFDSKKKCIVDGHITIIRCDTTIINPYFLVYYLRSKYGQIQIEHYTRGTTGQIEIYSKDVELIKIPKISIKEQENLINMINKIIYEKNKKIARSKSFIEKGQKIKQKVYHTIFRELNIEIPDREDTKFFIVSQNDLEDRFDIQYYHPKYTRILRLLEKHPNIRTVGQISELITKGATPTSGGDAYTSEKNGIPFIRILNIKDDEIDINNKNDLLFLKKEVHNTILKRSQIKPNNVLLSMAGTIGKAVVVPTTIKEANINQALAKIVLKDGINPKHVAIFLNSVFGRLQMERLGHPTGQSNINFKEIAALKIIVPNITIQNKIVQMMKNGKKEIIMLRNYAEKNEKEANDFSNKIDKNLASIIVN